MTAARTAAKTAGSTMLAPFRIRNYRFQWPADLATSWGFEMETLILNWYMLVETGSVLMFTVFASLQYMGNLISPIFGVMGDRIGHRNLLCIMRSIYATLAATLMSFALMGALTPVHVFIIGALMGVVRPSDLVMRYSLIGGSMPPAYLMSAMSVARATGDSARIMGALAGASAVALLGMGKAYAIITILYLISLSLTLCVSSDASSTGTQKSNVNPAVSASPWRDLRDGAAYVWNTPHLLAAMCLAFLVNFSAFPLVNNLLAYVAKEIYLTDQKGLSYLVAGSAIGALIGSITMSRLGGSVRPARMMIIFGVLWYSMLMIFAQLQDPASGFVVLVISGVMQSLCVIPMSTLILRHSDERYRGRVMGIRMLAIYGVPPGLLIAGPLISHFGYATTATLYAAFSLAITILIAVRWRAHIWSLQAVANQR